MEASELNDSFGAELRADIENNRITLPTLPEVALQVRDAVESDNATAQSIADIVAKDAALSARLLQVANSPLYRGRSPVESIQMAVTRLGLKLVRSLVVSLAMKQIFQATSDALDKQFRRIWDDSLQIAAISRFLASTQPQLEPEQAMLAGLVHNIGALPILTRLDEKIGFETSESLIEEQLNKHAAEIGCLVLRHWNFSDHLADVPGGCLNLARDHDGAADYADLVLVARLQHLAGSEHPDAQADWSQIPAFAKVGLEPEITLVDVEGPAEEIAEVRAMLSG